MAESLSNTHEPPRLRARPCPICAKPVLEQGQAFCSKRCADVDLHRWLSGSYAIPAVEEPDPEDDAAADPERG
jgi:endogenous inhibitor of DNA gyrase (YacG/DUF329 family)